MGVLKFHKSGTFLFQFSFDERKIGYAFAVLKNIRVAVRIDMQLTSFIVEADFNEYFEILHANKQKKSRVTRSGRGRARAGKGKKRNCSPIGSFHLHDFHSLNLWVCWTCTWYMGEHVKIQVRGIQPRADALKGILKLFMNS